MILGISSQLHAHGLHACSLKSAPVEVCTPRKWAIVNQGSSRPLCSPLPLELAVEHFLVHHWSQEIGSMPRLVTY